MRRVPRRLSIGAATLAVTGALVAPAVATARIGTAPHRGAAANAGIRMRSAHGVRVLTTGRVGTRQLSVRIRPAALERPIGVQIVLPVGYREGSARRYPVLYLYPGTSGHSTDWTTVGRAVQATRRYPLITVSSDIGFNGDGGGWFTNWVDRTTRLGKSQWETYDIHELIPWIDANLDTIASRSGRAVAGLSQGGYGSTELAAHHPDLFTMMMSFSGAPEIDRDPMIKAGATAVIDATMTGLNGVPQDAPFGDPVTHDTNWRGHDPAFYPGNLRGMKLWFSTADGLPGKYDDPVTNPAGTVGAGGIESATHESTDAFLGHLRRAHVPYIDDDYGHGTHSWPYWARDLRKSLVVLMRRFAHPPQPRSSAYYKTINPSWSQWGWHVDLHRAVTHEFSVLSNANAHGFRIEGSGRAVVRTPRFLFPDATYLIRVGSARQRRVRSDDDGRLRVAVPLGSGGRTVSVRIAGA